ncbi:molybdenum cofactor guanylyltransferase MobA [Terrarubrum flagellatum]|uniref:molybdenum cofactor guanylyltransferase MobA n=1 Tax=Terrirubrum flagellatum TaxID=2895980 RepID=UPI0031455D74
MAPKPPPTLGLILAGGLARRMSGVDKPLIEIGGRSVLARMIDRLAPQCDTLLLNANGDASRFAAYDLPVIADSVQGFAGPLAGILAGLEWAAGHRPDILWVASVAGDTPFLPRDLVTRLHQAREGANADLACATSGGRDHPVIALWPVSLAPDLRRALVEEGERKVSRFMARYHIARAEWSTDAYDPFFNANTRDDIADAERIIAAHPQA